jgi:hypothetical protein
MDQPESDFGFENLARLSLIRAKPKKKKMIGIVEGKSEQGIKDSKNIFVGRQRVVLGSGGRCEGRVFLNKRAKLEEGSSSDGGKGRGVGSPKRLFPVICRKSPGKGVELGNGNVGEWVGGWIGDGWASRTSMVKDEVRISQEDLEIVINKKTLSGAKDRALEVERELAGPEVRVETLNEGELCDARDLGKIDGGGCERLGQGKPYRFDRFADLDVGMNLRQEAITIKGIFSKFGKGCGMKQFWSSRYSKYHRSYEFNIYEDTSRLYRIKGSFLGTQAWKWSDILREGQEYCFQGANIVIKRFHDLPGDS